MAPSHQLKHDSHAWEEKDDAQGVEGKEDVHHAPWIGSDEEQEGSEVFRVQVDVGQEGQRQEDNEEEDAIKAPGLEARREAGGERCALRHDY